MRHQAYSTEHFNLAGEYNKARGSEERLTLDEYCHIVREFGKAAITLDRTPDPDKTQRFTSDEVDAILLGLEPID